MVWFIGFWCLDREIFELEVWLLLQNVLSQQKLLIFKLKYLVIEPSKHYKLYHFQIVLFKAKPFSKTSKCKTFSIADDVIKKYGGFWVILGNFRGSKLRMKFYKGLQFHHLLFIIFRMDQSKFHFENFLKILFGGICTEKWRHHKIAEKGSKTLPIDCLFSGGSHRKKSENFTRNS